MHDSNALLPNLKHAHQHLDGVRTGYIYHKLLADPGRHWSCPNKCHGVVMCKYVTSISDFVPTSHSETHNTQSQ